MSLRRKIVNASRITHPSRDIISSEGNEIEGKKIVLCITSSIAAYKAIELARLLMRHGADVYSVMSPGVTSTLLNPEIMKWATGNDVITKLTGDLEHIFLADYNMSDLILIYPCTGNTIGKIANGIDDTPVTSVLSVALGSKIPIMIAPAMHKSMYDNEFIKQNICRLKDQGIEILDPLISEGKAKLISPEQVLKFILTKFNKYTKSRSSLLTGKNVLVTVGSTIEYIDPIRVITNLSSGKMGNAIAEEARKIGTNVTIIYGHVPCGFLQSQDFNVIKVSTTNEMYNAIVCELSSKKYDIVILAAAVTDFAIGEKNLREKIDTRKGKVLISLTPTKKIIDHVKRVSKNNIFLVAFKAEYNMANPDIIEKAYKKLKECNGDLIVANDIGREGAGVGSDNGEVFIIDKHKKVNHLPLQNKRDIARSLLYTIERYIDSS